MKFLEKVKNMFTEEVEEEVKPIKTEVRKVEIPAPIKQVIKEESSSVNDNISQNETIRKEEKAKAPVFFDDKDFDKLPTASSIESEKKAESKRIEKEKIVKKVPEESKRKEAYGGKNPALSANIIKEEKKVFKPTPIISPVYGVLDKNYKKDDITPKKKVALPRSSKPLTVDDIRNKAFGKLEDDLETTLFGNDSILFENEKKEKVEDTIDLFDELDMKVEEPDLSLEKSRVTPSRVERNKELDLLEEVEDLGNIIINERPDLDLITDIEEEKLENKAIEISKPSTKNDNMIEDEMDKIFKETREEEPELTESDLFSLIDSMYEKKEVDD